MGEGGLNPPARDHLPVEPPAPEILDPAGEGEEQQWNPMEWDRAAEELTWERLLGTYFYFSLLRQVARNFSF